MTHGSCQPLGFWGPPNFRTGESLELCRELHFSTDNITRDPTLSYRVLKGGGGGEKGEGVFLRNPKDSGGEDWGTLGKIRGITTRDP